MERQAADLARPPCSGRGSRTRPSSDSVKRRALSDAELRGDVARDRRALADRVLRRRRADCPTPGSGTAAQSPIAQTPSHALDAQAIVDPHRPVLVERHREVRGSDAARPRRSRRGSGSGSVSPVDSVDRVGVDARRAGPEADVDPAPAELADRVVGQVASISGSTRRRPRPGSSASRAAGPAGSASSRRPRSPAARPAPRARRSRRRRTRR